MMTIETPQGKTAKRLVVGRQPNSSNSLLI